MLAFGFLVGFASSFFGFTGVTYVYKPPVRPEVVVEAIEVEQTPAPTVTPTALATPTSTPTPEVSLTPKPTPTLSPTAKPTVIPTVNPVPTATPDVWSPPEMDPLFAQFAGQYGVDKNALERIAVCESHFNPNAANGDYLGMFQFSTSTWQNYRSQLGMDINPVLRTDITESIRTAAFMLSKRGTSAWPACID